MDDRSKTLHSSGKQSPSNLSKQPTEKSLESSQGIPDKQVMKFRSLRRLSAESIEGENSIAVDLSLKLFLAGKTCLLSHYEVAYNGHQTLHEAKGV